MLEMSKPCVQDEANCDTHVTVVLTQILFAFETN